MPAIARYAKTSKGRVEIDARQRNLPGKLRTMLILVDPSKSAAELRAQGARIGVAPDFLETLSTAGYIAPLGSVLSTVPDAAADRN